VPSSRWQSASVTQQDDVTLIIIDVAGTPWNADVVVSEVESALQIASMSQQIRKVTLPTGVHECKIADSLHADCSHQLRLRHDEMIVAMHKHAYHVISCGSFDAETRGSGTG
jgi:hypothetical protein